MRFRRVVEQMMFRAYRGFWCRYVRFWKAPVQLLDVPEGEDKDA